MVSRKSSSPARSTNSPRREPPRSTRSACAWRAASPTSAIRPSCGPLSRRWKNRALSSPPRPATPHLIAAPGVLGRRVPSAAEQADIAFGARIASAAAAMDIGQTVAVRRGIVIAIEAAEGTDAMIGRAGALAAGAVIVKVGRPRQDPRYDLPAVGPETVAQVAAARGAVLAVEAGHTLLLERERVVADADGAGIALVAVPRG